MLDNNELDNVLNTCKEITDGIIIKDLIEKYNNRPHDCTGDKCEVTWKPVKTKDTESK
jgi:hypothetical protein